MGSLPIKWNLDASHFPTHEELLCLMHDGPFSSRLSLLFDRLELNFDKRTIHRHRTTLIKAFLARKGIYFTSCAMWGIDYVGCKRHSRFLFDCQSCKDRNNIFDKEYWTVDSKPFKAYNDKPFIKDRDILFTETYQRSIAPPIVKHFEDLPYSESIGFPKPDMSFGFQNIVKELRPVRKPGYIPTGEWGYKEPRKLKGLPVLGFKKVKQPGLSRKFFNKTKLRPDFKAHHIKQPCTCDPLTPKHDHTLPIFIPTRADYSLDYMDGGAQQPGVSKDGSMKNKGPERPAEEDVFDPYELIEDLEISDPYVTAWNRHRKWFPGLGEGRFGEKYGYYPQKGITSYEKNLLKALYYAARLKYVAKHFVDRIQGKTYGNVSYNDRFEAFKNRIRAQALAAKAINFKSNEAFNKFLDRIETLNNKDFSQFLKDTLGFALRDITDVYPVDDLEDLALIQWEEKKWLDHCPNTEYKAYWFWNKDARLFELTNGWVHPNKLRNKWNGNIYCPKCRFNEDWLYKFTTPIGVTLPSGYQPNENGFDDKVRKIRPQLRNDQYYWGTRLDRNAFVTKTFYKFAVIQGDDSRWSQYVKNWLPVICNPLFYTSPGHELDLSAYIENITGLGTIVFNPDGSTAFRPKVETTNWPKGISDESVLDEHKDLTCQNYSKNEIEYANDCAPSLTWKSPITSQSWLDKLNEELRDMDSNYDVDEKERKLNKAYLTNYIEESKDASNRSVSKLKTDKKEFSFHKTVQLIEKEAYPSGDFEYHNGYEHWMNEQAWAGGANAGTERDPNGDNEDAKEDNLANPGQVASIEINLDVEAYQRPQEENEESKTLKQAVSLLEGRQKEVWDLCGQGSMLSYEKAAKRLKISKSSVQQAFEGAVVNIAKNVYVQLYETHHIIESNREVYVRFPTIVRREWRKNEYANLILRFYRDKDKKKNEVYFIVEYITNILANYLRKEFLGWFELPPEESTENKESSLLESAMQIHLAIQNKMEKLPSELQTKRIFVPGKPHLWQIPRFVSPYPSSNRSVEAKAA